MLDDKHLAPDLADGAPRAADHLCDACREHFDAVLDLLDALGVRHEVDHRLVRGLDYYTRTAFEFYVAGREGQQQALGGGGRYDGLAELLGGRPTPGHRLRARARPHDARHGGAGRDAAAGPRRSSRCSAPATTMPRRCASPATLREAGRGGAPGRLVRKLGKQLESAAKAGARWAVIVGEELERGEVGLKDLATGEQRTLQLEQVAPAVRDAAAG